MSVAVVIFCLFLLGVWVLHRSLDRRERILGCTHSRLEVRQTRAEYGGTLYLQCPERQGGCGHQAHLLGFRPLPLGVFMPVVDGNQTDEAEYTRLFYELCEVKAKRRESKPVS